MLLLPGLAHHGGNSFSQCIDTASMSLDSQQDMGTQAGTSFLQCVIELCQACEPVLCPHMAQKGAGSQDGLDPVQPQHAQPPRSLARGQGLRPSPGPAG